MREVFEIPAGRCRDEKVPRAEPTCPHLDTSGWVEGEYFCRLDRVGVNLADDDAKPERLASCPFGSGPIRMTLESGEDSDA